MNRVIKKTKAKKAKTVTPGCYRAIVTAVESPKGFFPGNAVDVFYTLTANDTGEVFPFRERFYISDTEPDERTNAFEDILDEIGAESYEEFVGCGLEVTFMYEIKRGKRYCNIVERKLISHVSDKGDDNVCSQS